MCSQLIVGRSDGTRPLELLEREITSLATQIHAATCRWLGLVAEYDAREGWAQWGCQSCAHWVAWQCGIAPGVAREHVRVARRLGELPLIRAAFAEGELSYSKVRALTRVENVEREQELLDLARHATASQLERLLRAYRGVVAAERAAAGEPPERWIAFDHADDGSVLLRGRLPAEEGALVLAALEAAQAWLAQQDVPAGTPDDGAVDVPAGTRDQRRSRGEARADALIALADAFVAGAARTGGDRYQVVVHVDAGALSGEEPGGRCELEDGSPLALETVRRLACDASLVQLLERDGQPLRSGARRAPSRPRCGARSTRATAAAASPGAGRGDSWTRTTSSTGPTAARPTSTTWSISAATTTGCCTRAATASPPPPAAGSSSTGGTGGRYRHARAARVAVRRSCRPPAGRTPACRCRTTGSTSGWPWTRC